MQRAAKRAIAGLVASAAAAGLLTILPATTASAEGTLAGTATLSPSTGNSETAFTLQLPPGASCTGDSANAQYKVTSYMVPLSTNPATLQFDPIQGPNPQVTGVGFSQPLYETGSGDPYTGRQTANATNPGGPGPIINIPQFDFATVFAPGDVAPGAYNIGIACVLGAPDADQLHEYWNNTITVTADTETGGASEISWTQGVVVPAPPAPRTDFDGDGDADLATFRPSNGKWYEFGGATTVFGKAGDVPVPGDYDGDGDAEQAVYRPSNRTWFVNGGATTVWGNTGDVPVPADYDGDGALEIATFRPSTGKWFVSGGDTTTFGKAGDVPVPGDYDGDGDAEVAVYRPSNATWYIHGGATTVWGTANDIPVPADFDGDGALDIATFRPSTGKWYESDGPTTTFGTSGDVPMPADYDGDGDADIAVFRPWNNTWFVNGGSTTVWGSTGDVPLVRPQVAS